MCTHFIKMKRQDKVYRRAFQVLKGVLETYVGIIKRKPFAN
jgi:hypothetical protein